MVDTQGEEGYAFTELRIDAPASTTRLVDECAVCCGFENVLAKPFDIQDLLKKVAATAA